MRINESQHLPGIVARNPRTIVFVLLCIVIAALYYRTPSLGYYFDDEKIVESSHQGIANIIAHPQSRTNPIPEHYYRPFAFFTFWLFHALHIESPAAHYTANMLLHLLAAYLAFCLMLQFRSELQTRHYAIAGLWAVFFAAGFTAAYSMTWVAQRFDLLTTVLFLIGLYAARVYWSGGARWSAAAAAVAFAFAMLSKETGYLIPALLPAWYLFDRTTYREREFQFRRMLLLSIIAGVFVAAVFLFRTIAGTAPANEFVDGPSLATHAVTYARALLELLQPVRSISILSLVEGPASGSLVLGAVLVGIPLILWIWTFTLAGSRRIKMLAAALLPLAISLGLFGAIGWVHPRLLYLPFALLCTAMSILFLGDTRTRLSRQVLPVAALIVFSAVISSGIVSRFQQMDAFNRQAVRDINNAGTSGYLAITQQATRFLHGKHHGKLIVALHSETDPVYMAFLNTGGTALFNAHWQDSTTLLLESAVPNAHFILAPSREMGELPPGELEYYSGCSVEVTRTALGGRPAALRVRFDSTQLAGSEIVIDNGKRIQITRR